MNAPWNDADDLKRWKLQKALDQSRLAAARVQGMKVRAQLNPPTRLTGRFPWPARTCAQWTPYDAWLQRQRDKL